MSAMTEAPGINMNDLSRFPRPVAKVVAEAVNRHGVRYRMMDDGAHLRLFNGDRDTFPCKVGAARPAEHTMRYLIPWLEQHVDSWTKGEVTTEMKEALVETVTSEPKPKKPKPLAESESKWVPYKYGFETDGTTYRCTFEGCDFTRPDGRGIHLHEKLHGDKKFVADRARKGGVTRGLKEAQRKIMRQEAARVIAEQNGLVVFVKGEAPDMKGFTKMTKENQRLTAENEKLVAKVGDLEARLALLREAMNA